MQIKLEQRWFWNFIFVDGLLEMVSFLSLRVFMIFRSAMRGLCLEDLEMFKS